MGQPFIGEIRMFTGNFPPVGWAFCDGTPMPISENDTLFALIGTTYGGDGQETFNLPDLRGRFPLHMGTGSGLQNYILGENGGVEEVTLTTNQIPVHSHPAACNNGAGASTSNPTGNIWSKADTNNYYDYTNPNPQPATVFMGTPAIISSPAGGSQPHDNMFPFLCVNFIISLFGLFPPPN